MTTRSTNARGFGFVPVHARFSHTWMQETDSNRQATLSKAGRRLAAMRHAKSVDFRAVDALICLPASSPRRQGEGRWVTDGATSSISP
jgi:hypothetical protein